MAIPVQQFPILSPQQANPLGTGFATGQNLYQQWVNNRYLNDQNQQALQGQALANALTQLKLNLAPQTLQADLAYKQAQTPYLQANTERLKQETQFLPLDTLIKAQQSAQQGSRFGGAYQLSKALQTMSPAARQLWIAQHQAEYNQMLNDLGDKNSANNFITPNVLQTYFPQLSNSNNPQSGAGQRALFSTSTPEEIQKTQLANQISANNALTTAATRRQYEGALQIEGIFNDPSFQTQAQNAALYAGAAGKGKAALSAISQSNPKAYEDYLAFQYQTLPLIESRIKTLDQMGASNAQRQLLENMLGKTANALTSNPKQFIIQLNELGKTLNLVARSVQGSASPLVPMNRVKDFNPIAEATKTVNGKTYHKIQGEWFEA